MKSIVVLGSSNTDMVVKSARIPAPGETVLGGHFLMNPGGKGANQAVAAARMGGRVTFVAKVGEDFFGREACALFSREGINTEFIMTDPTEPSGVALIMVDEDGENCIAVAPGANSALTPTDISVARRTIEHSDALLMQLEIPVETVLCAAQWAYASQVPVIINPAPACELPIEIFPCTTLLTPNENEAELLTGIRVIDQPSAGRAAAELCAMGVGSVVITLGARGAYIYEDGTGIMVAALPVKATDTTAAGDVFNGALAVGLTEGMTLRAAVSLATHAAAISVTRMGAQASAPRRAELDMSGILPDT